MSAAAGRDDLITAAEALYAERGIDGVSLREINVAAGARNASAVQYHFGGRQGLLRAILAKHAPAVEASRHALLDACEASGGADLRALAGALVRPLADLLPVPGGPGYLQLLSDLANRPRPALEPPTADDPHDSVTRWRATVEPLLAPEAVVLHRRFVAIRFTHTELARRTRDRRGSGDGLFVSDLVDLVTGLLAAPVSDETVQRDEARRRARATPSAPVAGTGRGGPAPS